MDESKMDVDDDVVPEGHPLQERFAVAVATAEVDPSAGAAAFEAIISTGAATVGLVGLNFAGGCLGPPPFDHAIATAVVGACREWPQTMHRKVLICMPVPCCRG